MTGAIAPTEPDPIRLAAACAQAAKFWHDQLYQKPGTHARVYIRARGLGPALGSGQRLRFGYAPGDGHSLAEHLAGCGFTSAESIGAGLVLQTPTGRLLDFFRDRIILPISAPSSPGPVGFTGRSLGDGKGQKYLNTMTTALFVKGNCLLGLAEQRDLLHRGRRILVVEGPLDAVAGALAGYVALSTCGTALTQAQLRILAALPGRLTLCFDGDDAGRKAAARALNLVHAQAWTRPVDAVALPDGSDPASLRKRGGPQALARVVERMARPLDELVLLQHISAARRRLDRPAWYAEDRIHMAQLVAPIAAAATAPRAAALAELIAQRLRIAPSAVAAYIAAERDGEPAQSAPATALDGPDEPVQWFS